MCFEKCRVRLWTRGGIRVGDRDEPERFARHNTGARVAVGEDPFDRVVQAVVGVRISVRPSIDGDGDDVACGIEPARAQNAYGLLADVALEGLECRRVEIPSAF